jgi:hypothetical protein
MKGCVVFMVAAVFCSPLLYAADGHDSHAMLYFSVPISKRELTSGPLLSLRDLRVNGMSMYRAEEDIAAANDDEGGSKPSKPLWKRPAFWIVTGTVVTLVVLADIANAYGKVYNTTPSVGP